MLSMGLVEVGEVLVDGPTDIALGGTGVGICGEVLVLALGAPIGNQVGCPYY